MDTRRMIYYDRGLLDSITKILFGGYRSMNQQYYPGAAPNPMPGYNPVFYGQNYAPRPQPRNTQPLTEEQIAKLKQKGNSFDWKVSETDLWRAVCTHKEKNGQTALVETAPDSGIWHCTICGATFHMGLKTVEEVKSATRLITDILQTAKSMYLDAPDALIANYFQIIPILEKLPVLWERALENFNMYEGSQTTSVPIYGNYGSGFSALSGILANSWNPMMNGGYPPQQPPAGYYPGYDPNQVPPGYYPPQQPPAPPAGYYPPQPTPGMVPGPNPFMYSGQPAPAAPAPGVMPGQQPPMQPVQPAAPAAPPTEGEVIQQKTFNV